MKTKIQEFEDDLWFTIEPETVEEMAMLLRFSNNVKAEKPSVTMSFSNNPYCCISLKKLKRSVQKTSISNT